MHEQILFQLESPFAPLVFLMKSDVSGGTDRIAVSEMTLQVSTDHGGEFYFDCGGLDLSRYMARATCQHVDQGNFRKP